MRHLVFVLSLLLVASTPAPIIRGPIFPILAASASFTDNFTRANANPMSTTASGGGTWTSGPFTSVDCLITSNQLGGTANQSGCQVASPTFGANQQATITIGVTGTADSTGVMVRLQSGSFSGYLLFADSTTQLTLYKCVDSGSLAFTGIGASFTVSALTAGDTIGISVSGSTFTIFKNGVSQGTRTDSTYSSGQPGVYFSASSHWVSLFQANDF